MELSDQELNVVYDEFEIEQVLNCIELRDEEMNVIYDQFEDSQKPDLDTMMKDLAFHNSCQAHYARNLQVYPVARDILSHQAWKELIGRGNMLTEEEWQNYQDYLNSCSACHRIFDQPSVDCCSLLNHFPCYLCELEKC